MHTTPRDITGFVLLCWVLGLGSGGWGVEVDGGVGQGQAEQYGNWIRREGKRFCLHLTECIPPGLQLETHLVVIRIVSGELFTLC